MTAKLLLRAREDRGSLPMALLFVMISAAVASLLLPIVLVQITGTTFTTTRARSLHAAQNGLEVAVAAIRAATTAGEGDHSLLPCGPLSSTADEGQSSYSVTIDYFYAGNPSNYDQAWRDEHRMVCAEGAGPFDPVADSPVPSFALLTSTGTSPGEARSRILQSTYIFRVTNRNINGGAIPLFRYPTSTQSYCLDAGLPLAAGNIVGVKACPLGDADIPVQQKWAYNTDLSIVLTATIGDLALNPDGTGLCLDTQGGSHAVNTTVVVRRCSHVTSGPHTGRASWRQSWSINSSGHFEGSKSDYSGLDGYCLFADAQPTNRVSLDQNCYTSTIDPQRAWNPMPSVGAGQAGEENGQLVNFAQFGRCVDVTNNSVATGDNGGTFLILYPCKQNPNLAALDWNQKWEMVPSVGDTVQWRTYYQGNPSNPYCLTSPRSAHQFVPVKQCTNSGPTAAAQRWTVSRDTDDDGLQLPYAEKYVIRDDAGLCLEAGEEEYNGNAKVTVAPCTGRPIQKWNADPNISESSVINLRELPSGSTP